MSNENTLTQSDRRTPRSGASNVGTRMLERAGRWALTTWVFVLLMATATQLAADQKTDYINSLDYDLRRLLSVSLESSSLPKKVDPFTRQAQGQEVIICRKQEMTAGEGRFTVENALLNPSAGVIYPGALVKLDQDLAEGRPTPHVFDRAPLKIKVGLPLGGSSSTVTVQSPDNVSVANAIEGVVATWLSGTDRPQPQIRAFGSSTKAYTKDQVGVELGFGAQWGESSVTANLSVDSTKEETTTIKTLKQVYYTVEIAEPASAGGLFAASAPNLTAEIMPATHPPGIVRTVDYGRMLVVVMRTNSAETKMHAEAAIDYVSSPGSKISGSLETTIKNILERSTVTVLAIGGSARDTMTLFSGSAQDLSKRFGEVVKKGMVLDLNNTGFPIAYTVADVKSRRLAKMNSTTRYIEEDCQTFPGGFVEFWDDGWFVARFRASWYQYDENGKLVEKFYKSGAQDLGFRHYLPLPGDAQNVTIQLYGDSCGLKEAGTYVSTGVPNKCYRVYGSSCFPLSQVREGGKCT